MTNTGKKTAEAILQLDSKVTIGGVEYNIPAPTYGTLIRLSAYINETDILISEDNVNVADLISLAKTESSAPEALAVLILGAKECDLPYFSDLEVEITEEIEETKYILGFIPKRIKSLKNSKQLQKVESGTKLEYLSNKFKNEVAISEIVTTLTDIISNRLDLLFFYKGITYLKGVNQIKRTKEI